MVLLDQGPTFMTSFSLNYFLEAPAPNIVTPGLGLQHRSRGMHKYLVRNGRIRNHLSDKKSSGHFGERARSPQLWPGWASEGRTRMDEFSLAHL